MNKKMIFALAIVAGLVVTGCQSPDPGAFREPSQAKPFKPVKPPKDTGSNDVGITFDFMHTTPNCAVPFEDGSGKMHKPTYCEGTSQKQMADAAGMEKRIVEMLDTTMKDPKNSKVFVAYFSFSNKTVQKKLCEIAIVLLCNVIHCDAKKY